MLLLEDEAKTMDQLGIDDGIQVLIEGRYIVSEFLPENLDLRGNLD